MRDFAIGLVKIQPQGEFLNVEEFQNLKSLKKSELKKQIAERLKKIQGLPYLSHFTYRKGLDELKKNLLQVMTLNSYHFEHYGCYYAQKIEMNIQKRVNSGELKWKSRFPFRVLKELHLVWGDLRKFKN